MNDWKEFERKRSWPIRFTTPKIFEGTEKNHEKHQNRRSRSWFGPNSSLIRLESFTLIHSMNAWSYTSSLQYIFMTWIRELYPNPFNECMELYLLSPVHFHDLESNETQEILRLSKVSLSLRTEIPKWSLSSVAGWGPIVQVEGRGWDSR
jgi:hypothetical protein